MPNGKSLVTDFLSTDRFVTEMCFMKTFQQMTNQSSKYRHCAYQGVNIAVVSLLTIFVEA